MKGLQISCASELEGPMVGGCVRAQGRQRQAEGLVGLLMWSLASWILSLAAPEAWAVHGSQFGRSA